MCVVVCFCVSSASVPLPYTQETSINVCRLNDHTVWTLNAEEITMALKSLRPEVARNKMKKAEWCAGLNIPPPFF